MNQKQIEESKAASQAKYLERKKKLEEENKILSIYRNPKKVRFHRDSFSSISIAVRKISEEEIFHDDIIYESYEVTATICSISEEYFDKRTAKLNCAKRFGTDRAYQVTYPKGMLMKDVILLEHHKVVNDIYSGKSIFDPYKRWRR